MQKELYLFMDRHNWRFKMAATKTVNFWFCVNKAIQGYELQMMISFIIKRSQPIKIVEKVTLINIFWNPRWPPPKITVFLPWDFEKVMTRSKPVKTWSNTVFSSTLQVWKGSVQNLLQEEVLNIQKASKMAVLA